MWTALFYNHTCREQKKAKHLNASPFCWGTRTRTKNDRTRICSVTITPYPNVRYRHHLDN